jgi:hypothetical protein
MRRVSRRPKAASQPKGPVSRSTRAASTPRLPIEQVIGTSYPWCSGWAAEFKELFAAYVEAKQKQNVLDYDDLLLYRAQMVATPVWPMTSATASIMCLSTSIRIQTACSPRSCSRSSLAAAA